MKTWAMNYDCCISCKTTDKPHHGNGLCKPCYFKTYKPPAQSQPPAQPANDTLEPFINALPILLKEAGIMGYTASYKDGTVTIKKLHSTLSATWPK